VKLLQVRDLHVQYPVPSGWRAPRTFVKAIQGVSFDLTKGETLGVVGESGAGKTTLARTLLRLTPASSGRIRLQGQEWLQLNPPNLRQMRRLLQLIFPDAAHSLDPRRTAGQILGEALDAHQLAPPPPRRQRRIHQLLQTVGLAARHAPSFPQELGPAQRQRLVFARALAVEPQILVCDDPLAGLDLPEQASIVTLHQELQSQLQWACLYLAPDIALIEQISHRILVLYLGKIVESGPARQVVRFPRHPYTQALVNTSPTLESVTRRQRLILPGEPPTANEPPSACPFQPRCPVADPRCRVEIPLLREIVPGQHAACHLAR
jgi:peptide/nickel transport system ATP-binding protein